MQAHNRKQMKNTLVAEDFMCVFFVFHSNTAIRWKELNKIKIGDKKLRVLVDCRIQKGIRCDSIEGNEELINPD